MKHIAHIAIGIFLISTGLLAADKVTYEKAKTMTLSGTIIDNRCAGAHKADIANFIKSHTKECALMPECAKSGYSLYHYGALIPFDEASSKNIETFLKKSGSRLEVVVEVKKAGEKYTLISIKNK